MPELRKYCMIIFGIMILNSLLAQKKFPEIDYQHFSVDNNWQINKQDSSLNAGNITLSSKVWLMHFLHWWPLTDSSENLSLAYATELLKTLWGMQFTLTENKGECRVNGHRAYYVEGQLGNVVKTRFIVWNCPESGRQFVSDCNINLALNTPEEYFKVQVQDITQSIHCHAPYEERKTEKLSHFIAYDTLGIHFQLPQFWHSDLYVVSENSDRKMPGYFKDGLNRKNGVIWNLITDSEKKVNLVWKQISAKLTSESFASDLRSFYQDTLHTVQDTFEISFYHENANLSAIDSLDAYFECDGEYDQVTEIKGIGVYDTSHYVFHAFSWQEENISYLLTAAMVAHDNFWGIPIDLVPGRDQFESFLDELRHNIRGLPISNCK